MGDFHTTSMCRFMVATQAALRPLATAPAATRHRRMQRGHLAAPLTERKNLGFQPLSRHKKKLSVYSGTLGLVDGATDDSHPKTLLAVMHTPTALFVVFASSVRIEEECPFELPLLAPAHRSCSGFRSLWGLGLSSCGSDFAALSLSMMEDFSPLSGALASVSLGPLLMIPSIMP